MIRAALLLACTSIAACQEKGSAPTFASPASSTTISSASLPAPEPSPAPAPEAPLATPEERAPVRTEDVMVPGDLPAVVVRGAVARGVHMVFVPGMCVHPRGYVESFQRAAAEHGHLVAVQGDLSCGGDGAMRRWSNDLEDMDRRIDAAFAASGVGEPREIVVIGYSQGAERGERLVARWPEKYSSAILIGSPVPPSKAKLARAHAAVLMAGTYDVHAKTQSQYALPSLEKALPVTFIEIPGARHGEMGDEPEVTMDTALDFVTERHPNVALDTGPPPANR